MASTEAALPKAVLFDMDDTVFDHVMTCRAALAALRRDHPYLRSLSLDALASEYGRLLEETHVEVLLGRRSMEDARRERFARLALRAGRSIGTVEAENLSSTYRERYQRLRRPVPGAVPFLRRISGRTTLAIVTNNTVAEQREKLAFLGLDRTIDLLVTSEEIGAGKPDPAIFLAALNRADARPSQAVMVGDSWESDVMGARSAGIRPVWFNRFGASTPRRARVAEFRTYRSPDRLEQLLATPPRDGPRRRSAGSRGFYRTPGSGRR
jgi:HAD superfamily hydrolase (TIGR01549 family)